MRFLEFYFKGVIFSKNYLNSFAVIVKTIIFAHLKTKMRFLLTCLPAGRAQTELRQFSAVTSKEQLKKDE